MERRDYTLEVYVVDRRTKQGERLYGKYEYRNQTLKWMQEEMRDLAAGAYPAPKYRFALHETWVQHRNIMSGEMFSVRYDTPWTSTPASETYWST